jgi:DNA-directed RNA polymerase specialized sigma24 family protein
VAKEQFERLLEGQPDHYQRILTLAREGSGAREIAEQTGVAEKTVRRVLQRFKPGSRR